MSGLRVQATPSGVRVTVRVQPRAASNEIVGLHGDALKIRLTAPPVDGAANAALVQFLSSTFDIPAGAITIRSGAGSRTKIVEMNGVSEARLTQLLPL
jgi:uncharacterized protein (TIGR00251 family)